MLFNFTEIIYSYVNRTTTVDPSTFRPSATEKRLFEMAVSFNRGLGFLPVLWGFYTVATIFLCYSLRSSTAIFIRMFPALVTQVPQAQNATFCLAVRVRRFWATVNLSVRYLQFDTLLKADQNCDRILNKIAFGLGY